MNNRRKLVIALGAGALATPLACFAQQRPAKIPRIGYLGATSPSTNAARIEAFQQGLRDLGYVEGKNIVIEYRYAEGKFDRIPALAAELVRLNVGVIVTAGPMDTRAAKNATNTIPIVMGFDNDPVGSGVVASLARPGGNITGLSSLAPGLSGKRLELLKEILPKLSRLAVLGNSNEPGNAQNSKEVERAAKAHGVKIQYLDVVGPKDTETAFRAASKERAEAALVLQSPIIMSQRAHVVELAAKNRLPATYPSAEYVQDGGFMFYGPSFTDLYRRAASYVDKILKGAKPGELPIEQPTKFELVINMKTAEALGIKIPQSVLIRADRVIE